MTNALSIKPETHEVAGMGPQLGKMAVMIKKMGGRAKDSKTALAVIALGAPNAVKAANAAAELVPFFKQHDSETAYRLTMVSPTVLRIEVEGATTTTEEKERQLDLDMSRL